MHNIPYLNHVTVRIPIKRKELVFCIIGSEGMWGRHKFENRDMALMLIDILYQNKMLNEATYRKIMNKYNRQERTA